MLFAAATWFRSVKSKTPVPENGISSIAQPEEVHAELKSHAPQTGTNNLLVATGPPGATNLAWADLVARSLDSSLPQKDRRAAARKLGQTATPEAMETVRRVMRDATPYVKAALAEGLGSNPLPEAKRLGADIADGPDEVVARGAIRGLADRGDAESIDLLAALMFSAQKPESIRTEAALALGDVKDPAALSTLVRAAREIQEEEIASEVLSGLGKRPFEETKEFFRDYLSDPGVSNERKAAALEGLAHSEGNPGSFLISFAENEDPSIRAAAAWALAGSDSQTDLGPQLTGWLQKENDPEVRTRLYQALGGQEQFDSSAVLALAQKEPPGDARLAALNLVAAATGAGTSPEVSSWFATKALPELRGIALGTGDTQSRVSAVLALSNARTPEALTALHEIAQASQNPQVVTAAQAGWKRAQTAKE
jgi:HEAT repeat protein